MRYQYYLPSDTVLITNRVVVRVGFLVSLLPCLQVSRSQPIFRWIWHRALLLFVHGFQIYKLKRYVNWLEYLHGYLALVAWTAALWITWVPLVADRQREEDPSSRSVRAINLGGRLLFGLACVAVILFMEKVSVQWIAMKFHERSYQSWFPRSSFSIYMADTATLRAY